MTYLSVQTKLDGFIKPALLRSETSTTSESSINEKTIVFLLFLDKGSTE
jgi:hypothetical protein